MISTTFDLFSSSLSLVNSLKSTSIEFSWISYLQKAFCMSDDQFGFRKGRSTVTPLLLTTHQWHKSLESKHQVACVFFDYTKAFDSVPHQALLNKLYHMQVSSPLIRWFDCYLSQRLHRVILNGQCSAWLPVLSGVNSGTFVVSNLH